jgi:hypothetical protein
MLADAAAETGKGAKIVRTLVVEVDGSRYVLDGREQFTFGRDRSCTVCLATDDAGVSRTAGRIAAEDGVWSVTNLSRKRPLHIVDSHGFVVPLPVAKSGWPASRRAVDQPRLTVLVAGDEWTYALTLNVDDTVREEDVPPLRDPVTTRTPMLQLTDKRREVLVALARGYLRPYPHYDPRPKGYDEIADLLGLTHSQVARRIEDVRELLAADGVEGLDGARDSRRALCEWLLAMRLITPGDLDWLTARIDAARARSAPARPVIGPSTSQFNQLPQVRVGHAAHRAARVVAPVLQARMLEAYGADWLVTVNAARRGRGIQPGRSLDDDRFCLGLFARDRATSGWVGEDLRTSASVLKSLADAAAHNRALPPDAVTTAQHHAERLGHWAASRQPVPGSGVRGDRDGQEPPDAFEVGGRA